MAARTQRRRRKKNQGIGPVSDALFGARVLEQLAEKTQGRKKRKKNPCRTAGDYFHAICVLKGTMEGDTVAARRAILETPRTARERFAGQIARRIQREV